MEIYLPKFTCGQIYIALLRATSKERFMIVTRDNERNPCEYANNVMFEDVLGAIKIGLYYYNQFLYIVNRLLFYKILFLILYN